MSWSFGVIGAVTVIALTVAFVRNTEARTGAALSAAVSVFLLVLIGNEAANIRTALSGIVGDRLGEYSPYIIKSVCIGFFTQTAYDVCADSGERGIASKILTAGKLGILTVCLPLLKNIFDAAIGYIK